MIRNTLILLTAVLAAGAAHADDRAVIVGVNSYPYLDNADLLGARGDALKFYDYVTSKMGFRRDQVTMLVDADATDTAILNAIKLKLIDETAPGDRVVFYFSGHGTRIQDFSGDEDDKLDEILIASNAGADGSVGVVVDDELDALFSQIEDRDVLVVIDSCHSGTATRTTASRLDASERERSVTLPKSEPGRLTRSALAIRNSEAPLLGEEGGRTVWSATAASQVAFEVGGEGIFTKAFLLGLSGHADQNFNGVVTNSELLSFVRTESEKFCAQSDKCRERGAGLTPDFRGRIGDVAAFGAAASTALSDLPDSGGGESPDLSGDDDLSSGSSLPVGAASGSAFLTDLFASRNDAGLRISISPSPKLVLAQTVEFAVVADRPGDVLLLDLDPKGQLHQIFPSMLSARTASRVAAGEVVLIPEARSVNGKPLQITVTEPAGSGSLLAILIEDNLALARALIPEGASGGPIADGREHLFRLARELSALQSDVDANRRIEWSAVVLDYTISP